MQRDANLISVPLRLVVWRHGMTETAEPAARSTARLPVTKKLQAMQVDGAAVHSLPLGRR
jgi:hypothetical protein